jgi:hypothetical protein
MIAGRHLARLPGDQIEFTVKWLRSAGICLKKATKGALREAA